jgi:hypothetical protein
VSRLTKAARIASLGLVHELLDVPEPDAATVAACSSMAAPF